MRIETPYSGALDFRVAQRSNCGIQKDIHMLWNLLPTCAVVGNALRRLAKVARRLGIGPPECSLPPFKLIWRHSRVLCVRCHMPNISDLYRASTKTGGRPKIDKTGLASKTVLSHARVRTGAQRRARARGVFFARMLMQHAASANFRYFYDPTYLQGAVSCSIRAASCFPGVASRTQL